MEPLSAVIVTNADRIRETAPNRDVQREALLFKIQAVPALREALFANALGRRSQHGDEIAAFEEFAAKGYAGTRLEDVAARAKVSKGLPYLYFKTKEDILLATLDYRLDAITVMLEEWDREHRTPVERLRRFVRMLVNSRQSTAEYGCPMGSLNTELGKDQGDLQEQAENLFKIFENWLSDQFAELGYAGRARELALRLMAFGQGINVMAHVHSDPAFLRREKDHLANWLEQLADGNDDCA